MSTKTKSIFSLKKYLKSKANKRLTQLQTREEKRQNKLSVNDTLQCDDNNCTHDHSLDVEG